VSLPSVTDHDPNQSAPAPPGATVGFVWPPLLVALATLAGSLWLSIGMGLKACPLCFYQRTFVMGVVAVLAVGLLTGDRHRGVLNVLALPLAVAGVGVALFHVYLEVAGKLECPAGVLGLGTAPQQSLAALAVLLALVGLGARRKATAGECQMTASAAGVVVGVLLAVGAVLSAPPMPPAPSKAYEAPLDMCRPPFRSP
jgi:disulfide bond formation protein DsbB